jgi:penicillin-binding protein 2
MRRYFIKRPRYLIEPEEILLDADHRSLPLAERLEFAIPERSLRLFFFFGIAGLLFLAGYVAYLDTVKHEWYAAQAQTNRLRLVFEQAPRGKIYDRFGDVLAENKEVFDVAALPLAIPHNDEDLRSLASKLTAILGVSAEEAIEKLQTARKSRYAEPFPLWRDIGSSAASAIEHAGPLPGIKLVGRHVRLYPKGPAFSHLLGYTGTITKEEFDRLPDASPNDLVGRGGVEEAYDAVLRGKSGKEEIEVNAALEVIDMRRSSAPEPGQDLVLTVDAEFQSALYQIMTAYLAAYGYQRAAAVALQPKTGEVLALVSIPSFDNNRFAEGIGEKEYAALLRNSAKPLFNRVIQGLYSPGSTVKPLLAVAALEEGIVTPETRIDASKGYIAVPNPYDPAQVSIFRDWRAHGWVDIRRAIAWSSNVFFYVIGGGYEGRQGLGITKIDEYLKRFGFGAPTGIPLPGEAGGLVPDPAWKAKNRPNDPYWRLGDTYITSIGQGDLLVTPLQLAVAHAAIANGGTLVRPYVVVGSGDEFARREIGASPAHIRVVQEGMRLTTAEGSARSLGELPFETAGKTGTVQVTSGRTNAVFSVYGPADDPEIELVVIVENGGEGSSTAVPIAKEALFWYWENRLKNNKENGIIPSQ